MVDFPSRIPDCDSHSCVLLDLFIPTDASICCKVTFPLLENSDHVVISVSIDFLWTKNEMPHNLWLFLCWVGQMRDVSWEDTLNACAVSEICDRVHSEIHVSSPHCKYHVMLLWSTWFSAACAAGIIHRNHFFVFTNRINLLNLKLSSDSISHCKRGLEAVKFTYANKTKAPITFQKLGSWDFWWIPNSILNKGKYAILPLFNSLKVASSASDKAILFPRNFSKNSSNLEDPGISLPAFPSWTNLKLHIYVTPKMVKNVIENLESSKASDLDCIPVVV